MNDSKSVGELSREYLDSLRQKKVSTQDLANAQQEVLRFVRWFNSDQLVRSLRPSDIERYVEEVSRTAAGSPGKLQPVRDMLAYAKKHGYTSENLAAHVRVRRPTTRKNGKNEVREVQRIQMTAEGLEQLKADLQALYALRPLIAEELARAMADKDFRENAPLDAARDRQAQVEARIRELEAQIRMAEVVTHTDRAERVALGRTVTLIDLDEQEEVRFVLVSPSEVDIRAGRISTNSPTGRMLLDRRVGDEISVEAPAGRVRYRVVKIE
ncbi:MAG: transcription elongation factor GreA [Chloroflexota bacterium]|nr:transcription elongation factor GreA [Dehalococcoidia bacterium]MDW8253624.1 transcription elongation factor GreA [Chloroflexota bacterium]